MELKKQEKPDLYNLPPITKEELEQNDAEDRAKAKYDENGKLVMVYWPVND